MKERITVLQKVQISIRQNFRSKNGKRKQRSTILGTTNHLHKTDIGAEFSQEQNERRDRN
jgi:hypothetical protein